MHDIWGVQELAADLLRYMPLWMIVFVAAKIDKTAFKNLPAVSV
jgi:hypothetical protein